MPNDWMNLDRAPSPLRLQVVAKLRTAITEGRFPPGSRLIERALCEQFGVSRPLVREAVRQLETEGLVEVVANRGPIVRGLTIEETADILDACVELEGLCARYFATRGNKDDIERFGAALDHLEAMLETGDAVNVRKAKLQYYEMFFQGAHSPTIANALRLLNARLSQYWASSLRRPERKVEGRREMRQIFQAIERGDADAACAACQNYVRRSGRFMLVILAEDLAAAAAPRPGRKTRKI